MAAVVRRHGRSERSMAGNSARHGTRETSTPKKSVDRTAADVYKQPIMSIGTVHLQSSHASWKTTGIDAMRPVFAKYANSGSGPS